MKDKIVDLMKNEGLTTSRLADILGIQPSGISHIVSGRNKPSFDMLQKILRRFPRINPDWLLLDSPTMYRDDVTPISNPIDGENSIDLFSIGDVSSADNLHNTDSKSSGQNSDLTPTKSGAELPQNFANLGRGNSEVESIIILYRDGTFTTYKMR